MKRREFITLLGSTAAAWPRCARSQQRQSFPRIGFLGSESPSGFADHLRAFHQGLSETGYSPLGDARNVVIEFRWASGQLDQLPKMAADLVRREVAVIAASDIPAARAARTATTTIPIVWMSYQGSNADSYRAAGVYVGRILKGERPSDLPALPPR